MCNLLALGIPTSEILQRKNSLPLALSPSKVSDEEVKKERGKPHLPLSFAPSERGIMQPMSNTTAKAISSKLRALMMNQTAQLTSVRGLHDTRHHQLHRLQQN
jgi:hypothetical protein